VKQTFHAPGHLLTHRVRLSIIGTGGTGSQVADGIASMECTLRALGHPGFAVTLYDPGMVRRANVGRQRFTEADIGQSKAQLLAHRINLFFGVKWNAETKKAMPKDLDDDIILTCTDSAGFRANVGIAFKNSTDERLWLDFGNGRSRAQCVLGHLAGKPKAALRLPNVYDLYPELAGMEAVDRDAPSCSMEEAIARQEWPVNRQVATAGVTLLWNLLRKGQLTDHGCQIDTDTLSMTALPIDPEGWAFFGYQNPPHTAPLGAKRKTYTRRVA